MAAKVLHIPSVVTRTPRQKLCACAQDEKVCKSHRLKLSLLIAPEKPQTGSRAHGLRARLTCWPKNRTRDIYRLLGDYTLSVALCISIQLQPQSYLSRQHYCWPMHTNTITNHSRTCPGEDVLVSRITGVEGQGHDGSKTW